MPGPIKEVACWAHTHRRFFDELQHHKTATAKEALDRIGAIYAVEACASFAPIDERVALRREVAPLIDALFKWSEATVVELSSSTSPNSRGVMYQGATCPTNNLLWVLFQPREYIYSMRPLKRGERQSPK
jgi:hypothetical protein